MTKTKAKTVTCFLLGAEGVGVLAAFVVSVLTIAEWGGASISGYGKWIVCNGFYLLSAMALFYGFVFRPIRRKAVETFSSVIHFGRWTFYAEGCRSDVCALRIFALVLAFHAGACRLFGLEADRDCRRQPAAEPLRCRFLKERTGNGRKKVSVMKR